MSGARVCAIAAHEARTQLRSPLFLLLLVFLGFLTSAINPTAMLPSGSAPITGVAPAVNSAHALAQSLTLTAFFGFPFLAAILVGLAAIRDDEAEVGDLLHSTPLTPAEYVVGKLLGGAGVLGLAITAQVVMAMVLHEGLLGDATAARGPFAPGHYLGPALVLVAPGVWFVAAMAFAAGLRFRRPMAVYAVPTALFTLTLAFTWEWAPPGLAPWLDRVLMVLDPTALRWLGRVVFAVDRGPTYYNAASLPLDATLLAGRFVTIALPALAVLAALRHFRRALGGAPADARRASRLAARAPCPSPVRLPPRLRMRARAPGLVRAAGVVAGAEVRHLLRTPAIYLYALFLMSVVLEVGVSGTDAYGTATRLTAGTLAVRAIPVVTLLVCLYLLFTVVEGLHREVAVRLDQLLYSAPVPTGAILLGKAAASAVVIGILTMACIVASAALLAIQADTSVALAPLLLVYLVVLGPTFIVWTSFVGVVMALVRQRAAALAVGFAVLVLTGVDLLGGTMTWLTNWPLWGALRWSDLGTFPLNGPPLWLNRGLALAVAVALSAVTLVTFRRREPDAARSRARWRDGTAARLALRLAPVAIMPVLVGSFLGIEVREGFQGTPARAAAAQYHALHHAGWAEVTPPALLGVDVVVALDPARHRMEVMGTYLLRHDAGTPADVLPLTVPAAFEPVRWTVAGRAVQAERHTGLHLLPAPHRLAPGDTVRVGFRFGARHPDGFTRNGGGATSFILPEGVVLSTRDESFLPRPGFDPALGAPRDEASPSPEPAFTARLVVRAPADYIVTGVGEQRGTVTRAGWTTTTWVAPRPVAALSIIAGRYHVQRAPGVVVLHHPAHAAGAARIATALAAARHRFSEWFHPYPWEELRLAEFPDLATTATSYPASIGFSEGVGFLTGGDTAQGLAFSVTAHEAAHQWWGHLVRAAQGPGTDLLVEGMANYATLLLHEAERGPEARARYSRQMERYYLEERRASLERPVLDTEGGSASDQAVLSQRGALVLWMLDRALGRESMLRALRTLTAEHLRTGVPVTPSRFLATVAVEARDTAAVRRLVAGWLAGTALPEYHLRDARLTPTDSGWTLQVTLRNAGTGATVVELLAVGNGDDRRVRREVFVEDGGEVRVVWPLPWRPARLVVDPDAHVLQQNRERAVLNLPAAKPD